MMLSAEHAFYAKTLIGILAIVNPLGAVPIFLSLCGDRVQESHKVAKTSAISVAIILISAIWFGDAILEFFGIGIPAFSTGGGMLIVLMAISMLHAKRSNAKQTQEEANEAIDKENIAVVPLAIPLMAGPGAISMAIVSSHQINSFGGKMILSAGIIIIAIVVWSALRLAVPIGAKIGVTGLNIATRVMGLLVVAIGVQMFVLGLAQLLPGLK